MKVAAQWRFWSLRPSLTAGRLEFGCWLAAGSLAVALAISPAAPARPSTLRSETIGGPQPPGLLAYRLHCIDRVLSSDLGMTEGYVVRQINRQCSTRRRAVSPPAVPTCIRLLVGNVTPLAKQVGGCHAV